MVVGRKTETKPARPFVSIEIGRLKLSALGCHYCMRPASIMGKRWSRLGKL